MPSKYSFPIPVSLNSREAGKFSFRHIQTNMQCVKQIYVKAQNVAHVACYVTQRTNEGYFTKNTAEDNHDMMQIKVKTISGLI